MIDPATRDTRVKLAIYRFFAREAQRPSVEEIAILTGIPAGPVRDALAVLRASRVLWLEPDGETIRMAPPFSGVPTQHIASVNGRDYFANCAWDALGIPHALKAGGLVYSRCEQSGTPLELPVELDAPPASDWIFHCQVPASHWWDDLPFT